MTEKMAPLRICKYVNTWLKIWGDGKIERQMDGRQAQMGRCPGLDPELTGPGNALELESVAGEKYN